VLVLPVEQKPSVLV